MAAARWVWLCCVILQVQLGPADESSRDDRHALAAGMRQRAQQTHVELTGQTQVMPAELVPQPVFRYSDQPRNILDASLWVWQIAGRPVAFQKIEAYRDSGAEPSWFYCFASTATGIITARWDAGAEWVAKKPGVSFHEVPGASRGGATKSARSLQAKQIARRFSVLISDDLAKTQELLRLLPQPVYSFGIANDPLSEGVVFGFAANGTNPDALLILQTKNLNRELVWEYGFVQMTSGRLTAEIDKTTVWSAPFQVPSRGVPSKFDSWLFFRETAVLRTPATSPVNSVRP